jgi:hypothetical protein
MKTRPFAVRVAASLALGLGLALSAAAPAAALSISTTVVAGVNSIQNAIGAAGASLTGNYYVFAGSGVYPEQVTISSTIALNGFQIIISSAPGASPTIAPPFNSTAAIEVDLANVSVIGFNIAPSTPVAYGVLVTASGVTITSVTVQDASGYIGTAGISLSSSTSVSYSSVTLGNANASGYYFPGSLGSSLTYSRAQTASGGAAAAAVRLIGAVGNTITSVQAAAGAGNAASLTSGSNLNVITASSFTSSGGGGFSGLFMSNAATNTFTGMFAGNLGGSYAVDVDSNANGNIIIGSTVATNGGGYPALIFSNAAQNTMSGSNVSNPTGTGVEVVSSFFDSIIGSTITGNGSVNDGILVTSGQTTTVTNSFVTGTLAGVSVTGSMTTTVTGSQLTATNGAGIALQLTGGSSGLTLATSLLTAPSVGLNVATGDLGALVVSSLTVASALNGVQIGSISGGFLSIAGLTFNTLAPGATAINLTAGVLVSTFSSVAFNDSNIGVNVSASGLSSGSSITMAAPSGVKSGQSFDSDPSGYVHWPSSAPPTSAVTFPPSAFASDLSTISGTAAAYNGASVSSVTISIQNLATGHYWNGASSFSSPSPLTFNTTVSTAASSWSYTNASLNTVSLLTGTSYQIQSQAIDSYAQTQSGYGSFIVVYDSAPPVVTISTPSPGSLGPVFPVVSGVSSDPISGVANVAVQISSGPSYGTCWNGSGWIGCPNLIPATGTATWTDTAVPSGGFLTPGTTYQILAQSTDGAGNGSIAMSSYTVTAGGGNCAISTTVVAGVNTIQGAVNAAGASLSGNYCVSVNGGNYPEQVTITGITTNGFRISITSGTGGAPIVMPPAGSTAAFVVANSSVSLFGLSVVPIAPVNYGVAVSSPFAQFSGVTINDPSSYILTAGILTSTGTQIYGSTVSANGAAAQGIALIGVSSVIISNAVISGPTALYLSHANSDIIAQCGLSGSTIGAQLVASNGNTISGSSVQGSSAAVVISGSTATTVVASTLLATTSPGSGLSLTGGSSGLTASSDTISGGFLGADVALAAGNNGILSFVADVIQSGANGLQIGAQGPGASFAISALTFQSLTPGATAINFQGGTVVSTFSGVAFDSSVGINVAAVALSSASNVTMSMPSGAKTGPLYSNDPNHYVHWPSTGAPVSFITAPAAAYVNSLPQISGTAQAFAGATVSSVAVSVQNLFTGLYWNGASSFSSASSLSFNAAISSAASWSYVNANLSTALTNGTSYQIQARATDSNAVAQIAPASSLFVFDTVPPTLYIQAPIQNAVYAGLPSVSGTSADGIGVTTVTLSVQKIGGNCFSPVLNNFGAACPSPFPAKGTPPSWFYSGIPWVSSHQYVVTAAASDPAGNVFASSNTFFILVSTGLGSGTPGDGQGTVALAPSFVAGCQLVTATATFTVGGAGIGAGGAIAFHAPSGWTAPQGSSTAAAGFVAITAPGGFNVLYNPAQFNGANLGPNWVVMIATTALSSGQTVQFVYQGYPGPGSTGSQVFSFASLGGGGGNLTPIAASPSLSVTPGVPAQLAFAPSSALTLGAGQNSAPMQIQTLDACGVPTIELINPITISLSAAVGGVADASAVFRSTPSGATITTTQIAVDGGIGSPFYFNTSTAGATVEYLQASAVLDSGATVGVSRLVNLLSAAASIGAVSVDTGAPGSLQSATITAGGAPAYVNFTLSNSALNWEVIISSVPGAFTPKVADFTGTGNPGRNLLWNGTNLLAAPSPFLPPGTYYVEILAGGGSAVNTSLSVTIAPSPSVYGQLTNGPGATVTAVGPNAGPGNFAVASATGYFQILGLQNGGAYLIQASENVLVSSSVLTLVASTAAVATSAGTNVGSLTFQTPSQLDVSATLPFVAPVDEFGTVSVHNSGFTQTGSGALHFAAGGTASDNGAQSFGLSASTLTVIPLPPGVYEVDVALPALGISTAVTGVVVSAGSPTILPIALSKLSNVYGYAILPSTVPANSPVSVRAQNLSQPGSAAVIGGALVPVASSSAIYSLFGLAPGSWTVTAVAQGYLPASVVATVTGTTDIGTPAGGGLNLTLGAAGTLTGTVTVSGNSSSVNMSATCPNGAALCATVTVYSPTTFYSGSTTVVLATSTVSTSSAFSLSGLPDGVYFVDAQSSGYIGAGQNVSMSGGAGTASLTLSPVGTALFVTAKLPAGAHPPTDFKAVSFGFVGAHGETQSFADMTAGTTIQYFASSATVVLTGLNADAYQFQAFYANDGMYRSASAALAANTTSSVLLDLSAPTYSVGGTFVLASNLGLTNVSGQPVVVSSVTGFQANVGTVNDCLVGNNGPLSVSAAHLELLPASAAGTFASGPLQTSGCPAGSNVISPSNAAGTGPQLPNPYLAYVATIAANGSFSFPNVPPGAYQLRNNAVLDAAGDSIPQFSQTVIVTGTVAGLVFQIGSGNAVAGSVLAPTGAVLTRTMTVNLANAQGIVSASAQASFNGAASAPFSFPQVVNGAYTLLLQDSSYPKAYGAAPLAITVAGQSLTGLALQAAPTGTIAGHIAILAGGTSQFLLITPLNSGLLPATLQIQATSGQGAVGFASGPNGGATPTLDAAGEFLVDGLLPGTYSVTFTAPGTAGAVALTNASVPGVVVQGGSVSDVGTVALTIGTQLSGRITDASSGQALANIPVEALPSQRGSGVSSQPLQTLTDGGGRFVLNGLDPSVRYYDVYAAYRGNEQQGETLPPYPQTISPNVDVTTITALNFALPAAAASVTGRVVAPAGGPPLGVPALASGVPLPGAVVYLQKFGVIPLRNPIADIQFQTDIGGNFTIPSLGTGTYVLTATSLGYAPLAQTVAVSAGAANVGTLTMAQAGTLSGTLTNADGTYPSAASVSQIIAATADQSSVLAGALTTNPNTLTVSGYSISGFKPNLSYHVIIIDSRNGIVTPPEASNVVLTSTASATINITYRPTAPLAAASASRQGTGFLVTYVMSQPLRNVTAADNAYSSILSTFSAQGALSQFALSQDRTVLTALYQPGVAESSFTLLCSAYTTLVNPSSTATVNNQFPVFSTTTFFIGIDGLGQTNVANLNGGDVLVSGDSGRVTLPPGSFNVGVSSSVLITLQVAKESLAGTGASAAGARSAAARLGALRYTEQAYPTEILAAVAATPPTVNPLSAFYNIFLPLGVSTALSKPAQLTLAYSSGTDPSTLNLYWYNPSANNYVLTQDVTGASPVINTANRTITLNVNHFSTYVLFNSAQSVITGSTGAGALTADNFPNPFDLGPKTVTPLHAGTGACSPSCAINGTMIGISVPAGVSGDVTIRIFNLAGTRVRSFDLGSLAGGTFYYQNWDGTNDSGRPVASGAYIGELKVGSLTSFFRMAVIKGSGL